MGRKMQIQKKQCKINERLIKVLRKIDDILNRNDIYDLHLKISKILKFFISIQREVQGSVSDFSHTKIEHIFNSSPSKSRFFENNPRILNSVDTLQLISQPKKTTNITLAEMEKEFSSSKKKDKTEIVKELRGI